MNRADGDKEKLLYFFREISKIPRGSGNEEQIGKYLEDFAQKRGLWCYRDELHNVVIKKGGSKGTEDLPPVMLQGHTDMVCEKRREVKHDFAREGISLVEEDGLLKADGTTLGADNGAAIAAMLAVLDDGALIHPPLECVFTAQEEVGLIGANGLDKSLIQARTMINMDSEEEGTATVSCAGGLHLELIRPANWERQTGTLLRLEISGLMGGHSGMDIGKERQNANRLMARLIHPFLEAPEGTRREGKFQGRLANFQGGDKENAIPRECAAALIFAGPEEAEQAKEFCKTKIRMLQEELSGEEPGFTCQVTVEQEKEGPVLSAEDGRAFVEAVYLAPNGVQKRSLSLEGFVVASTNLAAARTEEESLRIIFSPRSSVDSIQEEIKEKLTVLGAVFGFAAEISGVYPGWAYREDSRIRRVFQESYQALFGKELKIEGIHAGLECGLFCQAIPELDCIAVGPDIRNCHTPEESLSLESFERFYRLIRDVLKRLTS